MNFQIVWTLLIVAVLFISIRYTKLGIHVSSNTPTSVKILAGATFEIIVFLAVLLMIAENKNTNISEKLRHNILLFFAWAFTMINSSESLSGIGTDLGLLTESGRWLEVIACVGGMLILGYVYARKRQDRIDPDLDLTTAQHLLTVFHVIFSCLLASAIFWLTGHGFKEGLANGPFAFGNCGFAFELGNAASRINDSLLRLFAWNWPFVWGGLGGPLAYTVYYNILSSVEEKTKFSWLTFLKEQYPAEMCASKSAINLVIYTCLAVNAFGISVLLHEANWSKVTDIHSFLMTIAGAIFDVTSAHTAGFNRIPNIGEWTFASQVAIAIVMACGASVAGTGGGLKYVSLAYFFGGNKTPGYGNLHKEVIAQFLVFFGLTGFGTLILAILPGLQVSLWWKLFYIISCLCNVGYDFGIFSFVMENFGNGNLSEASTFYFFVVSSVEMFAGKLTFLWFLFLCFSFIWPKLPEKLPGATKVS